MTPLRHVLIIAVLLGLQASLGRLISIGPFQPNFLAIYVIYWALRRGPRDGIWIGLAVGIVQDAVTTQFLGISPLSYVIVCFVIGKIGNYYPVSSRVTWIGWLLSGTILQNLIYFYFYASGTDLSFAKLLLNYALPATGSTTVLGALWSLTPWWRPTERRGIGLME